MASKMAAIFNFLTVAALQHIWIIMFDDCMNTYNLFNTYFIVSVLVYMPSKVY